MTESADDKLAVERCPQCARVLHDDYCSKCRRYVFVRKGTSVWDKFWKEHYKPLPVHPLIYTGYAPRPQDVKDERMQRYV